MGQCGGTHFISRILRAKGLQTSTQDGSRRTFGCHDGQTRRPRNGASRSWPWTPHLELTTNLALVTTALSFGWVALASKALGPGSSTWARRCGTVAAPNTLPLTCGKNLLNSSLTSSCWKRTGFNGC